MGRLTIVGLDERPELYADIQALHDVAWPTFLTKNEDLRKAWPVLSVYSAFAFFQFAIYENGAAIASGNAVPFVWSGDASDLPDTMVGILSAADDARNAGRAPTAVSALAAIVAPSHRGRGLSRLVIGEMSRRAARAGCRSLVAPVRPTLKASYPLTPLERYVHWTRSDGALLDPWLRVHASLGASLAGLAPHLLPIHGSIAEWEEWTGLRFPESGPYVVSGALSPVAVDRERDSGAYDDPGVWMVHPVAPADG